MIFIKVCIGGEDITHMVQTNEEIDKLKKCLM